MPFTRSCLRYAHTDGNTHCCYTDDGKYIITTGSDGDIRTWNGVDDDDPNSQCVCEHILYHAFHRNRILTSTDLNTVQSFTFPDYDRNGTEFRFTAPVTCIKISEKYIAACSEDMTIKVKDTSISSEEFEFTEHTGPVLRIALNLANLLASSSGDGTIKIWNLEERKCIKTIGGLDIIKSYQMSFAYATPTFEPTSGNYMAYNHNNSIVILETQNWTVKKTLTDEEDKSAKYTVCSYSTCGKYIAAGKENGGVTVWNIGTGGILRERKRSNETDAQCITSIDWNPKQNGELAYTDNSGQFGLVENIIETDEHNLDDECDEVEENDNIDFGDIEFTDDAFDADNENCVSLEKLKAESLKKTVDDEIDEILDRASSKASRSVYGDDDNGPDGRRSGAGNYGKIYHAQAPFQPGETPRSLEHRYMIWNHVGIVRAHTTNTENSIEVEFHDASIHHGLHMVNHLNHTIGSLSATVLALCNESSSKLVCIMLGGSGGSREWSVSMPNCEGIQCVAASAKLVAVATDARYLRIFSPMGTQREVVSLAGQAIALASQNNRILVAYHSSAPSDDQHISMMIIEAIGLNLRCRDVKLALSPNAKLTWIGYSDRGSPVTYDSSGMLRMFSTSSSLWLPICDTTLHTKGASDNFFIIEVSEATQTVRAIMCRGANYPVTTPKPMVSEIKMQMPVCDIESEQSQLEETLIRYSNFTSDDSEKNVKEIALKLFSIACRSENESRAKELVEMIGLPTILSLAIKYANTLGRIHLAERLTELEPEFKEQQAEKQKYVDNESAHNVFMNTPTSTHLLNASSTAITTPKTLPKPLSISQLKRNPFKRTPKGAEKATEKAFNHLTDGALGFGSDEKSSTSPIVLPSAPKTNPDTSNGKENLNTDNTAVKASTSKVNFVQWYAENKDDLEKANPELSSAELMKLAMDVFRTKRPAISTSGDGKRKMDNNGEKEQSGISKLARFSFDKR